MSNSGGEFTSQVVAGNQTPGDAVANPADCIDVRAFIQAWNGVAWLRVGGIGTFQDNAGTLSGLVAAAFQFAWNPTEGGFDRIRVPVIFKTGVATALGATAIWTPAAGKKFRLMAYSIEVTANAAMAAAGLEEITLLDAAAAIGQGSSVWLPNAALTTSITGKDTGMRQLGNGYLSVAINQALNVNLGTALTAGEVRVNAIGTED